jgi:hypothetical protein
MLSRFTAQLGPKEGTRAFYATANKLGIRNKVDPGSKRYISPSGKKIHAFSAKYSKTTGTKSSKGRKGK